MARVGSEWRIAAAALLLAGALALPVGATNTANMTIQSGQLTVEIAPVSLAVVSYSALTATSATGSLTLTVDDADPSDTGWNATLLTSDFACSCGFPGSTIPAANLTIASIGDPTVVAGEPIDPDDGPFAVASSIGGTLDTPRKVVTVQAGSGNGRYAMPVGVTLTVPAGSRPATYTATLTITYTAAP